MNDAKANSCMQHLSIQYGVVLARPHRWISSPAAHAYPTGRLRLPSGFEQSHVIRSVTRMPGTLTLKACCGKTCGDWPTRNARETFAMFHVLSHRGFPPWLQQRWRSGLGMRPLHFTHSEIPSESAHGHAGMVRLSAQTMGSSDRHVRWCRFYFGRLFTLRRWRNE